MLGSAHDAEDAGQEAMLRAWGGLARIEGRNALRSWLTGIATNASLDAIGRRPKRVLPVDYGPASDPHDGSAQRRAGSENGSSAAISASRGAVRSRSEIRGSDTGHSMPISASSQAMLASVAGS